MTGLALVGHQFRYDQKAFWRNPASVFFTVMFPVLLLVIFGTIFGSQNVEIRGGEIDTDTYYVPAIISLSIISSTMQSLAMTLVIAREDGRLKRGRGTPMPSFKDSLPEADRWALAYYILSLSAYKDPLTGEPLKISDATKKALDNPSLEASTPDDAYVPGQSGSHSAAAADTVLVNIGADAVRQKSE